MAGTVPNTRVRQTTLVTVAYLGATALLIIAWGRTIPYWTSIVAAHLAACAGLTMLRRRRTLPRALSVMLDWHPLALFPILYKEVELLAGAIGDWRLTAVVAAVEAQLFGGQPSIYLSERLSFVPLSEFLHFCYLAYVLAIPGVAAYWYLTNRRAAFHELVLLLAIVMLGSYLFFILYPVDSPFYRVARLGPPLTGHVFVDLVHYVSSRGGARGGAFPSAHASGAAVLWMVAFHHQRRLALLLSPFILGLCVATVYGRFHYVVDTVAGLGFGLAVAALYRRYARTDMLSRMRPTRLLVLLVLLTSAPLGAQSSLFQPSIVTRPDVKQAFDSVDARATGIVDEWIKLVQIPAPSTKEQARAAYIKAELQKLGLGDLRVDDLSNVSAVRKGTGGGPTVVFAAHLDTVFPEGTNVTVTRDGDVLRGPGVGDDTSNLTATLEMFRALDRGGVKTKGDLIFLATAQEELGLVGARHWLATSGYKPDMFVAVDLSAEAVWYGALRITQYKFFFTSPGAHTMESRAAPSPAKAVSQAIAALYEIPLPPIAAGLGTFKLPVLNVGTLGGGTATNAVPREAWFSVDLRSLDTNTQGKLEQAVEAAAKRVADREKVGFRVEKTTFFDYAKARSRDERLNSTLVQTAVATANHFRKPGTPAIVPMDVGSTDANTAVALGIHAVAVGAVTQRFAHRLEENADASSIVPGIKALIALAVSLGGS